MIGGPGMRARVSCQIRLTCPQTLAWAPGGIRGRNTPKRPRSNVRDAQLCPPRKPKNRSFLRFLVGYVHRREGGVVPRGGIEPPTPAFSVPCSTN